MPNIHTIHPLIDFLSAKSDQHLVFSGTEVPLEKLFKLLDSHYPIDAVNEFLRQYPEVNRMTAYAVLALAGRYQAFALENFLSYSSEGLSNQVWGSHVPNSLAEFEVDWKNLVLSAQIVSYDQFRYFAEIYNYGNTIDGVVFGRVFKFGPDPEFERLLEHSLTYRAFDKFIPTLFSQTLISAELIRFAPTPEDLQLLLTKAQFHRVSPFYLEAKLSEYLYHTGIYKRFFKDHTIREAQEITSIFLDNIFGEKPEERLCFISQHPWGEWFDKHSCTDLTLVGINRYAQQIWLFTVTDSD